MEDKELSPPQLLEALVAVVATLGEVAATVTGQHRGVRQRVSPEFLPAALGRFTSRLCETLDHGDVTSLGHHGVPSLGRALATVGATPGATWADVKAAAKAWQKSVARLEKSWERLTTEAIELRDTCREVATATTWAGDPRDEAAFWDPAWDNLRTSQWSPVALDRDKGAPAGATHKAQVSAVTSEAVGEAVVATRQARAAIRRGQQAKVALGPLQRLVDACDRAIEFTWDVQYRLGDIEDILEWTDMTCPDVPRYLVAEVAKFEHLWEASACLFTRHLLGTLGDIHALLLSPYGGPGSPGGPGGPGSRAVAERCQKAIEDIPRLLQGHVTAVTSLEQ